MYGSNTWVHMRRWSGERTTLFQTDSETWWWAYLVWRCFAYSGVGHLLQTDSTQNKEKWSSTRFFRGMLHPLSTPLGPWRLNEPTILWHYKKHCGILSNHAGITWVSGLSPCQLDIMFYFIYLDVIYFCIQVVKRNVVDMLNHPQNNGKCCLKSSHGCVFIFWTK